MKSVLTLKPLEHYYKIPKEAKQISNILRTNGFTKRAPLEFKKAKTITLIDICIKYRYEDIYKVLAVYPTRNTFTAILKYDDGTTKHERIRNSIVTNKYLEYENNPNWKYTSDFYWDCKSLLKNIRNQFKNN